MEKTENNSLQAIKQKRKRKILHRNIIKNELQNLREMLDMYQNKITSSSLKEKTQEKVTPKEDVYSYNDMYTLLKEIQYQNRELIVSQSVLAQYNKEVWYAELKILRTKND
ncbi:hypothetical protein ENU1_177920 [Entamoeba nuttalli P19]|uniref:Uncharacterized protein n=2 Tax=Entamoeba nuttalli TaxID=412467 RepID=K2GST4_ENTNP|nr:hypothetical protein ENU1_177920 [Entamoeba nuttalli P19]EKE38053.1 hypothetical protein ENU1_177920 [Entamoeba nuttalli P19]|eukprot:XP_008859610.1 hypothetical protein ENU1_177920 [Entamoeba nuttalli P19]